jgi:hypothetical protein
MRIISLFTLFSFLSGICPAPVYAGPCTRALRSLKRIFYVKTDLHKEASRPFFDQKSPRDTLIDYTKTLTRWSRITAVEASGLINLMEHAEDKYFDPLQSKEVYGEEDARGFTTDDAYEYFSKHREELNKEMRTSTESRSLHPAFKKGGKIVKWASFTLLIAILVGPGQAFITNNMRSFWDPHQADGGQNSFKVGRNFLDPEIEQDLDYLGLDQKTIDKILTGQYVITNSEKNYIHQGVRSGLAYVEYSMMLVEHRLDFLKIHAEKIPSAEEKKQAAFRMVMVFDILFPDLQESRLGYNLKRDIARIYEEHDPDGSLREKIRANARAKVSEAK